MKKVIYMLTTIFLLATCNEGKKADSQTAADDGIDSTFQYKVDRFADIEILRYPVPGLQQPVAKTERIYLLLVAGSS